MTWPTFGLPASQVACRRIDIQVLVKLHPLIECLLRTVLMLFVHHSFSMHVSHGIIQVTRKVVLNVDQLRLDLRDVFDEFLERVNAVVDCYIESPSSA